MITIEQTGEHNVAFYKEARLDALKDSPTAFGSTYANESRLTDADWQQRARNFASPRCVSYLAIEHGRPCGLVGVFLDEADPSLAHLVSMWVAPEHRRAGVGGKLIAAAEIWAIAAHARTLHLTVTNINQTAIDFYQRSGFVLTGETEPYPNDPKLFEYVMIKAIALAQK